MAGEVRIVSDGKPYGTRVFVGDNAIPGVVSVTWVSEEGAAPLVLVTIAGAEIDALVLPENAQIVPAAGAVETGAEDERTEIETWLRARGRLQFSDSPGGTIKSHLYDSDGGLIAVSEVDGRNTLVALRDLKCAVELAEATR